MAAIETRGPDRRLRWGVLVPRAERSRGDGDDRPPA